MSRTGHRGYRRNRQRIRDQDVCHICGQWIDIELGPRDPMAWEADHIVPIYLGGSNLGELAPSHRSCNQGRNRRVVQPPVPHARKW